MNLNFDYFSQSHGTLREYEDKLRNLNHKLNRLQGENNQLQQLVQDNNLDERHSLASQLKEVIHHAEAVETRLLEYERHIEVLDKNHFHQIEVENGKLKACNKKLFDARKEVEQLADAVRVSLNFKTAIFNVLRWSILELRLYLFLAAKGESYNLPEDAMWKRNRL